MVLRVGARTVVGSLVGHRVVSSVSRCGHRSGLNHRELHSIEPRQITAFRTTGALSTAASYQEHNDATNLAAVACILVGVRASALAHVAATRPLSAAAQEEDRIHYYVELPSAHPPPCLVSTGAPS